MYFAKARMPIAAQAMGSMSVYMSYGLRTIALIVSLLASVAHGQLFSENSDLKNRVAQTYGEQAVHRLLALDDLIRNYQSKPVMLQLQAVNQFFNQLQFLSDSHHWSREDYWATPVELLGSNGGDCEDFAIAKYLTLRQLGIPDHQLRLSYVNALTINQAHMVLAYLPGPGEDPLVLDNLIDEIKAASQRRDLKPVYSFNDQGLWLAAPDAHLVSVEEEIPYGTGDDILMWKEFRERLALQQIRL